MERKSLVLFSILVLLLAAQVVVKTEAQTEELKEELTEELTEAETEVAACERPIPFHGRCIGPIANRRCNAICVSRGAIRGFCRGGRCFCVFRSCPTISDVLTEALMEAQTEAQMEVETEVAACERPIPFPGHCIGPIANRRCNAICIHRGAIRGFCRGGRCICVFRHCPAISDVLEEW